MFQIGKCNLTAAHILSISESCRIELPNIDPIVQDTLTAGQLLGYNLTCNNNVDPIIHVIWSEVGSEQWKQAIRETSIDIVCIKNQTIFK
jgi:hypothetical protein